MKWRERLDDIAFQRYLRELKRNPDMLTLEEELAIEEQLPREGPKESFSMAREEPAPDENFAYRDDLKVEGTVIVSLARSIYKNRPTANKRFAELAELRGLKSYREFQTARHFCWYCLPKEK